MNRTPEVPPIPAEHQAMFQRLVTAVRLITGIEPAMRTDDDGAPHADFPLPHIDVDVYITPPQWMPGNEPWMGCVGVDAGHERGEGEGVVETGWAADCNDWFEVCVEGRVGKALMSQVAQELNDAKLLAALS